MNAIKYICLPLKMGDSLLGHPAQDLSVSNLNVDKTLLLQCQRLSCILNNLSSGAVAQITAIGPITVPLHEVQSVALLSLPWESIKIQTFNRNVDVIVDSSGTLNITLPPLNMTLPPNFSNHIIGFNTGSTNASFLTNLNLIAQQAFPLSDHTVETQLIFNPDTEPPMTTLAIKTMNNDHVKTLHGATISATTNRKTPGVYTALPLLLLSDLTTPPPIANVTLHQVHMQVVLLAPTTVNSQVTD